MRDIVSFFDIYYNNTKIVFLDYNWSLNLNKSPGVVENIKLKSTVCIVKRLQLIHSYLWHRSTWYSPIHHLTPNAFFVKVWIVLCNSLSCLLAIQLKQKRTILSDLPLNNFFMSTYLLQFSLSKNELQTPSKGDHSNYKEGESQRCRRRFDTPQKPKSTGLNKSVKVHSPSFDLEKSIEK